MDNVAKLRYKWIFVVLTYRETKDLPELLESIGRNVKDYKVIVVNSYFDEQTRDAIKEIAESNDCDFLNFPNKGYSFGNNRGIEYALKNYEFEWLAVANPDTILKVFDEKAFENVGCAVVAPEIKNLRGKAQNPMRKRNSGLSQYLIYKGCKNDNGILLRCGTLWGHIVNMLTPLKKYSANPRLKEIAVAHGSFVFISKSALLKTGLPYDENMFLFAEEAVLSQRMKGVGKVLYTKAVKVLHKEDGSMKFEKSAINKNLANANVYYYETYVKGAKE